jgi:hypothetical protein
MILKSRATHLVGKAHGLCGLRSLTDLDFARQAKGKRNRDRIAQAGMSKTVTALRTIVCKIERLGQLVATKSKLRGEGDAQSHAHCIFLDACSYPLNIDFYATFVTLYARGSARFRLEPSGQHPEGKSDVV